MIKKLLPGVWYGEVSPLSIEELHRQLDQSTNQVEMVLSLTELLKKGDFSVKSRLIKLMNETDDNEVLDLCIRLFCSVCTNEDLKNIDNLGFLGRVSEDNIFTFVTGAIETMSNEVIPYLFAIWEDWEDVDLDIDNAIRDSLNAFLDYRLVLADDAELSEIAELYTRKVEYLDFSKYYYRESPVFPGDFTKELVDSLLKSASLQRKSNSYLQVSLLSIFTGVRVPLNMDKIIENSDIQSIYQYIDQLITNDWKKGMKYFYGHPVEQ